MHSLRRSLAVLALLAVLPWLGIALLAQDSTVVVDHTGILGPVVDHFWPTIVTFLISATVWIVAKANAGFARTSEPVKWAALYAFALLYNKLAGWLGITTLDPMAPVLALSAVQTTAAALVYKLAGHAPPKLPDVSEARRI
jgi:hypothetical protein